VVTQTLQPTLYASTYHTTFRFNEIGHLPTNVAYNIGLFPQKNQTPCCDLDPAADSLSMPRFSTLLPEIRYFPKNATYNTGLVPRTWKHEIPRGDLQLADTLYISTFYITSSPHNMRVVSGTHCNTLQQPLQQSLQHIYLNLSWGWWWCKRRYSSNRTATHCKTLHDTATHCSALQRSLQHTATHLHLTLQYTFQNLSWY